jgi:hypothetical protein
MKRSNKILLAGLLTIIFTLIAIHIALYAKYKSGDYVAFDENTMNGDRIVSNYSNVNRVIIRNRANTTIRFGDSTRVEQDRKSDEVMISQNGGELIISGRDTSNHAKHRGYAITVFIKEGTQVDFVNAHAAIKESKGKAFSILHVFSKDSYVDIASNNQLLRIDSLQIHATAESRIYLGKIQVRALNVTISESFLIDEHAEVNKIHLNTDETSALQFQSKNIFKIKTNSTVNNE